MSQINTSHNSSWKRENIGEENQIPQFFVNNPLAKVGREKVRHELAEGIKIFQSQFLLKGGDVKMYQ